MSRHKLFMRKGELRSLHGYGSALLSQQLAEMNRVALHVLKTHTLILTLIQPSADSPHLHTFTLTAGRGQKSR